MTDAGERCPTCATELLGEHCHRCGERRFRPEQRRLRGIAAELLGELAHLDTRLLRTLRTLLRRPGELARAWSEGRRLAYTKPIALFLAANVLFFFVQPRAQLLGYGFEEAYGAPQLAAGVEPGPLRRRIDARIAASGESLAAYRERFEGVLQVQKKLLLAGLIPVLAALLALAYPRSGRTLVEHVVFAIHYEVAFLAWLIGVLGLVLVLPDGWVDVALFAPLPWIGGEGTFLLFLLATLGAHLFCALRRFYGGTVGATLAKVLALFAGQMLALAAYKHAVLAAAAWLT